MVTVPIEPDLLTPTVAVLGAEIEGVPDAGLIVKLSPPLKPPEIALPAASWMPVPELFRSRLIGAGARRAGHGDRIGTAAAAD